MRSHCPTKFIFRVYKTRNFNDPKPKLFELSEQDRALLDTKKVVQRMQVSSKDPYMNKPKRVWQSFHKPVASTNEIMESLEPYESRKKTEK